MFLRKLYIVKILLFFVVEATYPQISTTNKIEIEEELRRHLKKLERWGLSQLLFTEKQVDQRQMDRARSSTNPDELFQLALDEDETVRFYVAANKYTWGEAPLAGAPGCYPGRCWFESNRPSIFYLNT